jgi:hypothetical protein
MAITGRTLPFGHVGLRLNQPGTKVSSAAMSSPSLAGDDRIAFI